MLPTIPLMRPLTSRRRLLVASLVPAALAAALLGAPTRAASKPAAKKTAVEKDAEAFLASVTSLMWPVSTATASVDWVAATDVTPEHTGERTGAEKAYAALVGSK